MWDVITTCNGNGYTSLLIHSRTMNEQEFKQ